MVDSSEMGADEYPSDLESILARFKMGVEAKIGKYQIELLYCAYCGMKLGIMIFDAKDTVGWSQHGTCTTCVKKRLAQRGQKDL